MNRNRKVVVATSVLTTAFGINLIALTTSAIAKPLPTTVLDAEASKQALSPTSQGSVPSGGTQLSGCPGPDSYQPIVSAADLSLLNINRDGSFRLCNDIVLPDDFSYPINPGSSSHFMGILEGNGFRISNIKTNLFQNIGATSYAGASVQIGVIRNIKLSRPTAPRSLERGTGVLAQALGFNSLVENVEIDGGDSSRYTGAQPYGNDDIGFLASAISNAQVRNLRVTGTLISKASLNFIGGVAATCYNSNLEGLDLNVHLLRDPSSYANPQGAGGVVGGMIETFGCRISDVRGSVDLQIGQHAGGIVGQFVADNLEITNVELIRSVIDRHQFTGSPGINYTAGGFVGAASGALLIQDAMFSGEIRGGTVGGAVGGLQGLPQYGIPAPILSRVAVVSNRLSGLSFTGGLIGNSYSKSLGIENSYVRADLTTEGYSGSAYGGLVGAFFNANGPQDSGQTLIMNSYYSGNIDVQSLPVFCVGAVVGCLDQVTDTSGITNVYFNETKLARNDNSLGTARSEQAMRSGSTAVYPGFDFTTVWAPLAVGQFPELRGLGLCPADVNRDGVIAVQDLFDFLNDFFASQNSSSIVGRADWNASGVVNSQDIFDFLADYQTPCRG